MKLTERKLKQLIIEELNSLNELDPFGGAVRDDMPPTDAEIAAQSPATDKEVDPTKSVSQLKKDLFDASKNIQNVKGLDPKEIELISATLGMVLQLASQGSAATILQRIYNVLQKQAK